MTLHLSNYLQHPPYDPYNNKASSVNTTSHNLCTTTNNTMMMYQQHPTHDQHDHNYNQPMIIHRNMYPEEESGFYSGNELSHHNTPNSNQPPPRNTGMTQVLQGAYGHQMPVMSGNYKQMGETTGGA